MRHSSALALAVALAFAGVSPAFAQDEPAIAAARSLGQEGVIAAQAGRCEEAVEKLTKAKKLLGAPTILVPLGECQIALGKIVAGTENLQVAAREILGADAPKAFIEAQEKARKILPDAIKKLARINIVVDAPANATVKMTDNGEDVSSLLFGVERPADPGKHVIVATAPGFLKVTQEVSLISGQRERVTIKLELDPNAKPDVVPPPPDKIPPDGRTTPPPETLLPAESGPRPLVVAGGVALGIGGAGLVLGGIFGGLASSKKSNLDEVCENKSCPAGSQEDIDDMRSYGNVSTATFVIGGVGAALGGTLLGIGLSQSDPATRGSTQPPRATVQPLIGPGFLGVRGTFL